MFKINEVKASFECDLCKKLLVDPVVIPCESTICKTHIDNILSNNSNEKKLGLKMVGNRIFLIFKKVCTWENNFEKSQKKFKLASVWKVNM